MHHEDREISLRRLEFNRRCCVQELAAKRGNVVVHRAAEHPIGELVDSSGHTRDSPSFSCPGLVLYLGLLQVLANRRSEWLVGPGLEPDYHP